MAKVDPGPHYCPQCRQSMRKEATLGFSKALEVELNKLLFPGLCHVKWACVNDSAYDNSDGIKRWEGKYKSKLNNLEKKFGAACKKHVEKNGFSGKESDLEQMFSKGKKKSLKDKLKDTISLDKDVKIPKKPPERVCCANHHKFVVRGKYDEKKDARKTELFFIYDEFSANMVKFRPLVMRILFPAGK